MNLSKRAAIALKKVDEVLWQHWDPIGVNDTPEALGEYTSYAPSVLRLVQDGADAEKIASHLDSLQTVSMGLGGNIVRCRRVARELLNLDV